MPGAFSIRTDGAAAKAGRQHTGPDAGAQTVSAEGHVWADAGARAESVDGHAGPEARTCAESAEGHAGPDAGTRAESADGHAGPDAGTRAESAEGHAGPDAGTCAVSADRQPHAEPFAGLAHPIPTAGQPHAAPAHGSARLEAAFAVRGGRTALVSKMHTAPLKIAKAFDCPHELAVIVMDASPGMLAGDRYELEWTAERNARVYLTNQGHTRVHPSPPGRGAALTQRFTLREGACVQSMMEPLMLYRDAELLSRTEVDLAPGAVWMSADILCPGRAGRGEKFAFRRYDAELAVRHGGELIYRSRQLVEPAAQRIAAPGAWEDCTHIGMLYCFSDRLDASHLDAARDAAEQAAAATPGGCVAGASRTWRHGIVVMAGGGAAWRLQRVLEAAWRALRRTLLDLPEAVWTG